MKKSNPTGIILTGLALVTIVAIARGKLASVIAAVNPADPDNLVNKLATTVSDKVIAPIAPAALSDDQLFARATLFNPFASAESKQRARNLLASIKARAEL